MIDEKSQETILVPHALGNIIHVGPIMRLNLCIKSRCMRARPARQAQCTVGYYYQ